MVTCKKWFLTRYPDLISRWHRRSPEVQVAMAAVKTSLAVRRQVPLSERQRGEAPPSAAARLVWPSLVWTVQVAWQDQPWLVMAVVLPGTLYIVNSFGLWILSMVH